MSHCPLIGKHARSTIVLFWSAPPSPLSRPKPDGLLLRRSRPSRSTGWRSRVDCGLAGLGEKCWLADVAVVSCTNERKTPSDERIFKSAATYALHNRRYPTHYVVHASPVNIFGSLGSVDTDVHNAARSPMVAGGRHWITHPRLPKLREIAVHAWLYKRPLACKNLRDMRPRPHQSLALALPHRTAPS